MKLDSAPNIPATRLVHVDLRQVIYALSDALDLVGIDDVAHGKRVGIMAAACARILGWSEDAITFMFDLGMLHDVGVSSTRSHTHLVTEFDWAGAQQHCEIGYALLRNFTPLAALAEPVRYHHTRWQHLQHSPEPSPQAALQANLVYLVDRVDAQAAPYYVGGELLLHTTAIRQKIQDCSGSYFAPQLVSAFLRASSTEAFWLQLEPRGIQGALQDMLSQGMPCDASLAQIKQLATIFSQIVDAKSAFTGQHSFGVARLARLIAERMGVDATQCDKLEIAALLHDLGKLRVPDEVLDKPAALDERERKIINAHSFETFQILHQIKGFEEIAHWAAYHHEEPNGNGYPFHICGDTLPLEARILRVADIFQALAQDRPYRAGLPPEAIAEILRRLVSNGRAERAIVDAALSDMNESMRAACP